MDRNSLLSGFSGLTSRTSSAAPYNKKINDIQDGITASFQSLKSLDMNEAILGDITESQQLEADFDNHIESIINTLTHTVYLVVSWAMFAEHKLIFSFSISVNILKHHSVTVENQRISENGYNFFLNSTLLADTHLDDLTNKIQEFKEMEFVKELLIDDKTLRQLVLLEETLPNKFDKLCLNMEKNLLTVWKSFMKSPDPYDFTAIEDNNQYFNFSELSKFQKLILIKLLRPDALITAVNHFIHEVLGAKFLNSAIPTLNELYNQSLAHTPIIFILSPGSDPTNQLLRFAKESRGSALHLDLVSLGKGQGPKAEELITKSLMLKGRWVFLQNCHLAASFMPRLQVIVNK